MGQNQKDQAGVDRQGSRGSEEVTLSDKFTNITNEMEDADNGGEEVHLRDGEARAYISGNRVIVRVDHPSYTATQLMRHEIGHDKIAKGEIDPDSVRERIKAMYGEENFNEIAFALINCPNGTYFFLADGYMSGHIVDFVSHSVEMDEYRAKKEMLLNEYARIDTDGEGADIWDASVSSNSGRSVLDIRGAGDGGEQKKNATLLGGTPAGDQERNHRRSGPDNGTLDEALEFQRSRCVCNLQHGKDREANASV